MKDTRDTEDKIRSQRDLLTVIRCILCLIPHNAVTLRDDLESMLEKLSYPEQNDLLDLNKELSLILFNHYDKCRHLPWTKQIMALYMDKHISLIDEKYVDVIDIDNLKSMCDKGLFTVDLDIHEEEQVAYITIMDTRTGNIVQLRKLQ